MELDWIDHALVTALLGNADTRLDDLSSLVKLAPSSVHDRLERLERGGIIRRWTIQADVSAFGLQILAYVQLRASVPCSTLVRRLEPFDSVEECHSVAGSNSLLLKVRVANTQALLDLVEALRTIPGIEGTETAIVLKTLIERPVVLPAPARPGRSRDRSS
ncbi:MAG: AsnC family transcriptional regulator protein [Gemmatimonadetes bacterium]|nr:AsnC family transcriptional regulator protein [Gemmatimonadota bacterium]